jgi:glycosyltransferase involved in cell wall biosynthesis
MAAAEVIGAGRPLVATKVGGIPELVGDAALLIEPDDANSLAEAVARVLTDEALAADLMAAARRRASGLPTDGEVVNQLVSCYRARRRR